MTHPPHHKQNMPTSNTQDQEDDVSEVYRQAMQWKYQQLQQQREQRQVFRSSVRGGKRNPPGGTMTTKISKEEQEWERLNHQRQRQLLKVVQQQEQGLLWLHLAHSHSDGRLQQQQQQQQQGSSWTSSSQKDLGKQQQQQQQQQYQPKAFENRKPAPKVAAPSSNVGFCDIPVVTRPAIASVTAAAADAVPVKNSEQYHFEEDDNDDRKIAAKPTQQASFEVDDDDRKPVAKPFPPVVHRINMEEDDDDDRKPAAKPTQQRSLEEDDDDRKPAAKPFPPVVHRINLEEHVRKPAAIEATPRAIPVDSISVPMVAATVTTKKSSPDLNSEQRHLQEDSAKADRKLAAKPVPSQLIALYKEDRKIAAAETCTSPEITRPDRGAPKKEPHVSPLPGSMDDDRADYLQFTEDRIRARMCQDGHSRSMSSILSDQDSSYSPRQSTSVDVKRRMAQDRHSRSMSSVLTEEDSRRPCKSASGDVKIQAPPPRRPRPTKNRSPIPGGSSQRLMPTRTLSGRSTDSEEKETLPSDAHVGAFVAPGRAPHVNVGRFRQIHHAHRHQQQVQQLQHQEPAHEQIVQNQALALALSQQGSSANLLCSSRHSVSQRSGDDRGIISDHSEIPKEVLSTATCADLEQAPVSRVNEASQNHDPEAPAAATAAAATLEQPQQHRTNKLRCQRWIRVIIGVTICLVVGIVVAVVLGAVLLPGDAFIESDQITPSNNTASDTLQTISAFDDPRQFLLDRLLDHLSPEAQQSILSTTLQMHAEALPAVCKAFEWLLQDDQFLFLPDYRLIQRFAMAVFYYSTNGDHWLEAADTDGIGSPNFLDTTDAIGNGSPNYLYGIQPWVNAKTHECSWFSNTNKKEYYVCRYYTGGRPPSELHLAGEGIKPHVLERLELMGQPPKELKHEYDHINYVDAIAVLNDNYNGDNLGKQIYASLQGTIPEEISLFTSLEYVNLAFQELTGTLPSTISTHMSNLRWFHVGFNNFSGTLPSFRSHSKLKELIFGPNPGLDPGSLLSSAGEWEDLGELEVLNLAETRRTGTVPGEMLYNMMALTSLRLTSNSLSGSLPTPPSSIAIKPVMEILDLADNSLGGALPSELGLFSALKTLDLSNNQFVWGIPSELGLLSNLEVLNLSGNSFTGAVAAEICALEVSVQVNCKTVSCPDDCNCSCS